MILNKPSKWCGSSAHSTSVVHRALNMSSQVYDNTWTQPKQTFFDSPQISPRPSQWLAAPILAPGRLKCVERSGALLCVSDRTRVWSAAMGSKGVERRKPHTPAQTPEGNVVMSFSFESYQLEEEDCHTKDISEKGVLALSEPGEMWSLPLLQCIEGM